MSIKLSHLRPVVDEMDLPYRSNYSSRFPVVIDFNPEDSRTKQEFKDDCDINIIMSRFVRTGQMPILNERAPQYLDATGMDYQSAMEYVAGAKSLFNELPSELRNRFNNNPGEFLDFCNDEKNRSEMAEMGLLKPKTEWAIPDPALNPPTVSMPNLAENELSSPQDTK